MRVMRASQFLIFFISFLGSSLSFGANSSILNKYQLVPAQNLLSSTVLPQLSPSPNFCVQIKGFETLVFVEERAFSAGEGVLKIKCNAKYRTQNVVLKYQKNRKNMSVSGVQVFAYAKNCEYFPKKCKYKNKKKCSHLKKNSFELSFVIPDVFESFMGEEFSDMSIPVERRIEPLTEKTFPGNRPLNAEMRVFRTGSKNEPCYL